MSNNISRLLETIEKHYAGKSGVFYRLRLCLILFIAAAWEKRKAQKEKKYLKFAENQLNVEVRAPTIYQLTRIYPVSFAFS